MNSYSKFAPSLCKFSGASFSEKLVQHPSPPQPPLPFPCFRILPFLIPLFFLTSLFFNLRFFLLSPLPSKILQDRRRNRHEDGNELDDFLRVPCSPSRNRGCFIAFWGRRGKGIRSVGRVLTHLLRFYSLFLFFYSLFSVLPILSLSLSLFSFLLAFVILILFLCPSCLSVYLSVCVCVSLSLSLLRSLTPLCA